MKHTTNETTLAFLDFIHRHIRRIHSARDAILLFCSTRPEYSQTVYNNIEYFLARAYAKLMRRRFLKTE